MGNSNNSNKTTEQTSEYRKQSVYEDILNGKYNCSVNPSCINNYKFNLDILNDELGEKLLNELIIGEIDEKHINLLLERGAQVNKTNLSGKYIIEFLFEREFYDLVIVLWTYAGGIFKCVEHGSVIPRRLFIRCMTKGFNNPKLLETFYKYGVTPLTTDEILQIYSRFIQMYNKSKYLTEEIVIKSFQRRMDMYLILFKNK